MLLAGVLQEDDLPLDVVLSQEAAAMAEAQRLRDEPEDAALFASAFGPAPSAPQTEMPAGPGSQQSAAGASTGRPAGAVEDSWQHSRQRCEAVDAIVGFLASGVPDGQRSGTLAARTRNCVRH
jgi:hypothetical protein